MSNIQYEGFYLLHQDFAIVYIILQYQIQSGSDADSDEKARYQDLHHRQLLKHQYQSHISHIRVIIIKKSNLLLYLGRASLKFFNVISWACQSGRFIFGPLQALLTRWSYLGSLTTMGSFGELKSPSENLVNVQKDCSWLRAILKKLLRRGQFQGNFQ